MQDALRKSVFVFLMDLLASTWRIKVKGAIPPSPSIIAFWHGTMMPVWKLFSGKNARAVVSQSSDGETLTALLRKWSYTVFRGSSSKGGKEVLLKMIEAAPGGYLLITPDGPRGPSQTFKAGAVITSQRTGVPLVLCGVSISGYKEFPRAWDKFKLPLPFARVEIRFSEPLIIPADMPREETEVLIKEYESLLVEMQKPGLMTGDIKNIRSEASIDD